MTCSILVGGAWGDEGKGKCITYLCDKDKPSIIARAGVGPSLLTLDVLLLMKSTYPEIRIPNIYLKKLEVPVLVADLLIQTVY